MSSVLVTLQFLWCKLDDKFTFCRVFAREKVNVGVYNQKTEGRDVRTYADQQIYNMSCMCIIRYCVRTTFLFFKPVDVGSI